MVISTSGYYSTGSSAVYALLQEYANCTEGKIRNAGIKSLDYENIVFYTPNGLFDLEDKLLRGNSIHRSDEALKAFKREMERLYKNDYIWTAGLKKILGEGFEKAYKEFIEKLIIFETGGHWEYHYGDNVFSVRKFLGSIKRYILHKKIVGDFDKKISYRYEEGLCYAFPTEIEFFQAAQKFVYEYFNLLREEKDQEKTLILNHFLLPHNSHRIPHYFKSDFRLIIVDRDPRDVYVMEKYRIRGKDDVSLLPCNHVEEFVEFWNRLRDSECKINDNRIIRIQFEDLIYNYEKTVEQIEKECNLSKKDHIYQGKIFSPERSKRNTQLFRNGDQWNKEIKYIETHLEKYIYPFKENTGSNEKIDPLLYGIAH